MNKTKTILFVAAINSLIVALELTFGAISNSLALITDALHNLGDVLALFVALIASYYALKAANEKMTFGYVKAEMMAAFINSLFLVITMTYVLYEAIMRFFNPLAIEANSVIIVATIALVINAISAYMLKDYHGLHNHGSMYEEHEGCCHHREDDLNMKAAYLHMLGDAVISLGVLLGGAATYYFQNNLIDPIITFIFGAYILKSSFNILKESFFALLDANPKDLKVFEKLLESFDEIDSYHDLHYTAPSSKEKFFSAHIVLKQNYALADVEQILEKIRDAFKHEFGITHILLQPETMKYSRNYDHCNSHI
jgi:cobalt-zinc-cadmium efflux system protein